MLLPVMTYFPFLTENGQYIRTHFPQKLLNGTKTTTLRAGTRWKAGDTAHLAVFNRSKMVNVFALAEVEKVETYGIMADKSTKSLIITESNNGFKFIIGEDRKSFMIKDGFDSYELFYQFFEHSNFKLGSSYQEYQRLHLKNVVFNRVSKPIGTIPQFYDPYYKIPTGELPDYEPVELRPINGFEVNKHGLIELHYKSGFVERESVEAILWEHQYNRLAQSRNQLITHHP